MVYKRFPHDGPGFGAVAVRFDAPVVAAHGLEFQQQNDVVLANKTLTGN